MQLLAARVRMQLLHAMAWDGMTHGLPNLQDRVSTVFETPVLPALIKVYQGRKGKGEIKTKSND